MSIIRLADLPAPPKGKVGWPWTEESRPPGDARAGGRAWPRVSVVTPSYNQAEFLEGTIRSVLLQGYPNLEYMVVDGGSTDGSVEIIEKYAAHLAHWESRPDRGQGHAINKGLRRSTGEILCWLNSDDFYPPGTLQAVATQLERAAGNFALAGHALKVHADGRPPLKLEGRYVDLRRLLQFWKGYEMHQPSIFWRREVFERVGYVSEELYLILDFDYWVRIARHFKFTNIDRVLSCATYHARAKTGDGYKGYYRELKEMAPRYWGPWWRPEYWHLKASMFTHYDARPFVRTCRAAGRPLKRLVRLFSRRPEFHRGGKGLAKNP